MKTTMEALTATSLCIISFVWDDRREMIQDLSYNLFERSGHFPMVEEQELFDQKLVEWIDRTIT